MLHRHQKRTEKNESFSVKQTPFIFYLLHLLANMPSLTTNNKHVRRKVDTCEYFISSDHIHRKSMHTDSFFVCNTILVIGITLLCSSVFFIGTYLSLFKASFFHDHDIYYYDDYFYWCFGLSFVYTSIMVHLSHVYPFGSIKLALALSLLIYLIINGIIMSFLIDNFEKSPNGYTHKILFHIGCKDYFTCEFFQLFYFYLHVYLPVMSPIIHCLLLLSIVLMQYLYLTTFEQCLRDCCFPSDANRNVRGYQDYSSLFAMQGGSQGSQAGGNFKYNYNYNGGGGRNAHNVGTLAGQSPSVTLSLQVEQSSILYDSPMVDEYYHHRYSKDKSFNYNYTESNINYNYNHNHNSNDNNSQIKTSTISNGGSITTPNYNNNNRQSNNYSINTPQTPENINIRHGTVIQHSDVVLQSIRVVLWYLLFWIIFGLFVLFVFFAEMVQVHVLKHHWESWYYSWLLVTSITKWILKKIGRKIDSSHILLCQDINSLKITKLVQMHSSLTAAAAAGVRAGRGTPRMTLDISNLKEKHGFSLEWLTELLMSMLYWQVYRQNVAYFLPLLNFKFFVFTTILHLLSEFCQTTIDLSKWYFNTSDKIIGNLQEMFNLDYNFDDSTYLQWTQRHSIDIVIRFQVSIASAIWEFIAILWFHKKYFPYHGNDLIKSYYYLAIGFGIEFVYFVLVFVINYRLNGISIVQNYSRVWLLHKKWFVVAWICVILLTLAIL